MILQLTQYSDSVYLHHFDRFINLLTECSGAAEKFVQNFGKVQNENNKQKFKNRDGLGGRLQQMVSENKHLSTVYSLPWQRTRVTKCAMSKPVLYRPSFKNTIKKAGMDWLADFRN